MFLGANLPENRGVANDCQQGRLELDYIQFGCVVQLEELAVIVICQQGGLYLDSGWATPGEQDAETTGVTLP